MPMVYNPYLADAHAAKDGKGGEGQIEAPDRVTNIVWQARAAEPTAEEQALAAALQAVFAQGVWDLPGVVAALNRTEAKAANGQAWTPESLTAYLAKWDA